MAIHGLPHTPHTDRYGSMVSDVGEGLGWVVAGAGIAWLGGSRGPRAGVAVALASLSATHLMQRLVKPVFHRRSPFVDRDNLAEVAKPLHASLPSGHPPS